MNESNRVRTFVLGTNQALHTHGLYVRSLTDLADGEIALVNGAGLCYDDTVPITVATDEMRFVVRNGNEMLYTPFFTQGHITASRVKTAVYDRNQVSYVGYNMSGNSIEVIDSNDYYIRIYRREWDMSGTKGDIKYGIYSSDATATESEIAYGWTKSLIANFSREPHQDIIFDRVYSGAVTEKISPGVDYISLIVTKGSRWVTLSVAPSVDIAVGDILNLAGVAYIVTSLDTTSPTTIVELDIAWQHESGYVIWDEGSAAATITVTANAKDATITTASGLVFAVAGTVVYFDIAGVFYKAKMINDTDVELDQPYQGASGTEALAGGLAATGGSWGIRMEGQDRPFAVITKPYNKVRFDVQVLDSGNTPLTYAVTTHDGSGMYEQVAWEEWFCQHAEGKRYNDDSAVAQKRALAVSTSIYNQIVIHYYDDTYTGSINGTVRADAEITIAIPEAFGHAALINIVKAALAT